MSILSSKWPKIRKKLTKKGQKGHFCPREGGKNVLTNHRAGEYDPRAPVGHIVPPGAVIPD